MTHSCHPGGPLRGNDLEARVRSRIDGLSHLPTSAAVAVKLMALGKMPEAGPVEYARIIASDASLSGKILALANSSWFGVRNHITKPLVAVNLLGLGTVRTLAISHCLAGLHNGLRLSAVESHGFWTASLCKAAAARQFAMATDAAVADEAYMAGLFQDFALPVMFSCDRGIVQSLLEDRTLNVGARLERERAMFNVDHAELGRALAERLQLPKLFIDAIAFHHDVEALRERIGNTALSDAIHAASLFPHDLRGWNADDAGALRTFIGSRPGSRGVEVEAFLAEVESEYGRLHGFFEPGPPTALALAELLEAATREAAEDSERLVGAVHELLGQAAAAGREVRQLQDEQGHLQEAALRDPLTGALNRNGFTTLAEEAMAKSRRERTGMAALYFDVDRFKTLNDTSGHHHGDTVLRHVASAMMKSVRPGDLVGRFGGDEFVVLLSDCSREQAIVVGQRILSAISAGGDGTGDGTTGRITVSVGLCWRTGEAGDETLSALIVDADRMMYEAKRAGGDRLKAA